MKESRIKLALITANYSKVLSYYDDWQEAFETSALFETQVINCVSNTANSEIKTALENSDAVILLHSTNGDTCSYIKPHLALLQNRKIPLLSFVGNEVNLPGSPLAEKIALLKALKPEFIATQLLQEAGEYLYQTINSKVIALPHALNALRYNSTTLYAQRPYDIGTRAVKYIAHLGDNDRNKIHDVFAALNATPPLKISISHKRLERTAWVAFLNSCKGTIATEAGSWYLEHDDATVNAIRAYILSQSKGMVIKNDSILRKLGHKIPASIKNKLHLVLNGKFLKHELFMNEKLDQNEIFEMFFKDKPKAPVYSKGISSRHFDAAGTKTVQILLEGRYNDILDADKHYIKLNKDYSNLNDVLERFSDETYAQSIADNAFNHIKEYHSYENRLKSIYQLLTAVK